MGRIFSFLEKSNWAYLFIREVIMPFLTHYLEIFITKVTLLTTATALRKGNMMRGFVHQAIKMPERKVRSSVRS